MKLELRLFLVRHGEAEHHHKEGDFERHLTKRGIQQATWLGQKMSAIMIPVALVSKAVRTLETAQILFAGSSLGANPQKLVGHPDVYMATQDELVRLMLQVLKESSESCLMVVGHNPGISLLVQFLTGQAVNMETADLFELKIASGSWEEALWQESAWTVVQHLNNSY